MKSIILQLEGLFKNGKDLRHLTVFGGVDIWANLAQGQIVQY